MVAKNSTRKVPVTVAVGDGIGPEIMDATMRILEAAGAGIAPEYVILGEKAFKQGIMNGVTDEAWASLRKTGLLLKSPLTTPQGGGYKSVNVTLRKTFGLFSNVRPVRTFEPYIASKHQGVDMVIVRENEEDLYAGIEYRQTLDSCHSVKFISRTGTEMIVRYAFEFARAHGRKKVTCLVKDNIMKISDGLFHKTFDRIGRHYPDIKQETLIVDIGMARVADTPENFDVIVTLNLYGDIVSDIASQVSGSVGVAGSMNIGRECAMFEAVHGSAPDIAGKGIANPSGLLNGAILLLEHIGQGDVAAKIGNAWLATVENGFHTVDIATDKNKALGTAAFADKVIEHIGKKPTKLTPFKAGGQKPLRMPIPELTTRTKREKKLVGVDVFVDWNGTDPKVFGEKIEQTETMRLKLSGISSRGLKLYPSDTKTKALTDHWTCRFKAAESETVTQRDIRDLLAAFDALNLKWTKVENLFFFDEERGFSVMQGE